MKSVLQKEILFLALLFFGIYSCRNNDDNGDLPKVELSCENITSDKTLPKAEYTVNCAIDIRNGAILTIEPGSVFKFSSDGALSTSNGGAIKALGTADKPIVFTAKEPIKGFWKGINIATNSIQNVFTFCKFEYGGKGSSPGGLATVRLGRFDNSADEARSLFSDCVFSEGGASGLFVNEWSTIEGSVRNSFINNELYPVWVSFEAVSGLAADFTFDANGRNVVYVESFNYNVISDITFKKLAIPYYLNHTGGSPLKRIYGKCIIEPGVEIKMGQGLLLSISNGSPGTGSIYCVGSGAERIKISGWEPLKGYWDRIRFEGSMSLDNRFEYVDMSDGGGHQDDVWADSGMLTIKDIFDADSRITILNSSFSNSPNNGIHLFECSGSTVNGVSGAVNIKNELLGPMAGNTFSNIDGEQVITEN